MASDNALVGMWFMNDGCRLRLKRSRTLEVRFHPGAAASLNYNSITFPNHSLDVYSTCKHYQLLREDGNVCEHQ